MILLSFFSVLLLILNPVLIYIFRRLEINLQKYQFWIMVSTGIVWVISLVTFLLKPAQTVNLTWDVGSPLLPSTVFTLDNITSPLILAINSILFAAALFQNYSPEQMAWLSALGGVSNLCLMADTPYTLLLVLSLIELILITNFITSKAGGETTRRKMLAIIARLLISYLVLFATLGSGIQSSEVTFSSFSPEAGPSLIAAGLIASLGWFGFFKKDSTTSSVLMPQIYSELLPSAIGFMLILRGSMLVETNNSGSLAGLVVGVIALAVAFTGYLIKEKGMAWTVTIAGIIAGAAIIGSTQEVLVLSLVFLLPGYLLMMDYTNKKEAILFLALASIGIITLPFLPAWSSTLMFGSGIQGYLFAIAYGLAAGGLLSNRLRDIFDKQLPSGPLGIPLVVGSASIILTQLIFAISTTLVLDGLRFGTFPVASWIPAGMIVIFFMIGNRLPEPSFPVFEMIPPKLEGIFETALANSTGFVDQVIVVLTGLFEGDGGLIWALLIAFLIISLGGG